MPCLPRRTWTIARMPNSVKACKEHGDHLEVISASVFQPQYEHVRSHGRNPHAEVPPWLKFQPAPTFFRGKRCSAGMISCTTSCPISIRRLRRKPTRTFKVLSPAHPPSRDTHPNVCRFCLQAACKPPRWLVINAHCKAWWWFTQPSFSRP